MGVSLGLWFSAFFAGFLALVAVAPQQPARGPELNITATYTIAGLPPEAAACMADQAVFVADGLTLQSRPAYGSETVVVTVTDRIAGEVVATAILNKLDDSSSTGVFTLLPPHPRERQQMLSSLAMRCQ